jgi:enoyl-CoA hydratase
VTGDEGISLLSAPAVSVQRDGAVAVVRLARPDKANAMDGEMTGALLEAVRTLGADPSVRAMVLTGDGSAFSAGGDIDTIRAMRDDRAMRGAVLGAHQDLFWTMTRLPTWWSWPKMRSGPTRASHWVCSTGQADLCCGRC